MKTYKITSEAATRIGSNEPLIQELYNAKVSILTMLQILLFNEVGETEMDIICQHFQCEIADLIEVPGLLEMLGECLDPKNNQI